MSRRSQTELAVLGALAVEPATGYGVRQAITQVLGHFWQESFGQIYPTLATLEAKALVKKAADGRFRITASGRRVLAQWLTEPVEPTKPRNGFLLRLFFASHLPKGARSALLDRAHDDATAALARFEELEQQLRRESHADRDDWLVTVRYGVHHARATLAWVAETKKRAPKRT